MDSLSSLDEVDLNDELDAVEPSNGEKTEVVDTHLDEVGMSGPDAIGTGVSMVDRSNASHDMLEPSDSIDLVPFDTVATPQAALSSANGTLEPMVAKAVLGTSRSPLSDDVDFVTETPSAAEPNQISPSLDLDAFVFDEELEPTLPLQHGKSMNRDEMQMQATTELMSTVDEIEQTVLRGQPKASSQLEGVAELIKPLGSDVGDPPPANESQTTPNSIASSEPLVDDSELEEILAANDRESSSSSSIDFEALVGGSKSRIPETAELDAQEPIASSKSQFGEVAFIKDSVESLLERSIRESAHHSLHTEFSSTSTALDRSFFESIKSEVDPWANFSSVTPAQTQGTRMPIAPPPLPQKVSKVKSPDKATVLEPMGLPDPPFHPIRTYAQTVVSRWGEVYVETSDCGPAQSKFRVRVITDQGGTWFKDIVYTDLLEASGKPMILSALAERFEALHEGTRRIVLRKGVNGLDGFNCIDNAGDAR